MITIFLVAGLIPNYFSKLALDYCANHLVPNSGHEIEILILYKEKVRTVLLIHHHLSLHDSSIRKTKKEEKIHTCIEVLGISTTT